MPLIVEGPVPPLWEKRARSQAGFASESSARGEECVHLALINNMPDPALEDTEIQFFELLDIASGDLPVYLKLYSATGVPRAEQGQRHLNNFYFGFDDLWRSRFDGMIITGTEPRQPNLRDEPYWGLLADVFDWASRNTGSTILSCLAAHASVLHFDGINRHRLPDKQFGVFTSKKKCDSELLSHAPEFVCFPHSRWNEVREDELTAAGYALLTSSAHAGADLFVKEHKRSLFVHFQGHPEYGAQALLKEYQRDIKRFLRSERDTYPTMPEGYFGDSAIHLLNEFRETAMSDRRENIIEFFPKSVIEGLENRWQSSAVCVYRNWLTYIDSRKSDISSARTISPVARARSVGSQLG
jgi:homoserine O-succinyltransferase